MKRKIKRVVHATAPYAIRDREDFANSTGNLRGETTPDGLNPFVYGWLTEERDRFQHDAPDIRYVVYSFDTPIAWWTEDNGWYVVKERFSVITSAKHQSRLYLIP